MMKKALKTWEDEHEKQPRNDTVIAQAKTSYMTQALAETNRLFARFSLIGICQDAIQCTIQTIMAIDFRVHEKDPAVDHTSTVTWYNTLLFDDPGLDMNMLFS